MAAIGLLNTPSLSRIRNLQALALVLLSLFFFTGCQDQATLDGKTVSTQIAGKPFKLELALDADSRFQGLSDRKSIPDGTGMLFAYPSPQVLNFVMRKCYVPIDIIYLEPSGNVIKTYAMTVVPYDTPEEELTRYSSVWPAQYVIEIQAGQIEKLGVKEGDKILLPFRQLTQKAQ